MLRESVQGSIAITVLFACAAISSFLAGRQLLAAGIAQKIALGGIGGIYIIAGIPSLVDLFYDLSVGHIDTHVSAG